MNEKRIKVLKELMGNDYDYKNKKDIAEAIETLIDGMIY